MLLYEELVLLILEKKIQTQKDWNDITSKYILDDVILDKYFEKFNVDYLIQYQTIPNNIIYRKILSNDFYFDNKHVTIFLLTKYQNLSIENIIYILDKININNSSFKNDILINIFTYQPITSKLLIKYKHKLDNEKFQYLLEAYIESRILSQKEINTLYVLFKDKNYFLLKILTYQNVNMNFIEKHKTEFTNNCWKRLFKQQKFSEQFIINNQHLFDLRYVLSIICQYQTLSNDFIERNKSTFNAIDRNNIYRYQKYIGNLDVAYNPKKLI